MDVYLGLVDLFLTEDGGHVYTKSEAYWIQASTKSLAAVTVARYVRQKYQGRLIKDQVVRVINKSQWGVAYFDLLKEECS